jgi:D-serine deaminase-like pyridoxal phosphate-dependent protein
MRQFVDSPLAELPTPALVLDLGALDRNIRRMAEFFGADPCRLRPHFKAHKTPGIARRQLAAGACAGLTCATVGEAEIVAAFCENILIANEIVGPGKCERVAALAQTLHARAGRRGYLTVAIDSAAGLEALAPVAHAAGIVVGVLVDVNVGQDRCGVQSPAEAVTLARLVVQAEGVELRGVMGYEGHVQPLRARKKRDAAARQAMTRLVEVAERLRADGLPCDVVSGGGTGTYDISGRFPGVTEVQAGSYVLMDSDYESVGVPFEQAFHVRGTIVSRPVPDRCVADCGHKAITKDHGLPAVRALEGATVTALHDEHAVLAIPAESPVQVGDPVELVPSHTDPTINLHDVFYVIDGDRVVDVWPIEARGYPEHRGGG